FKEFVEDRGKFIDRLVALYGGDTRYFNRDAALRESPGTDFHRRRGEIDEWRRRLDVGQIERINAQIPDRFWSIFGWSPFRLPVPRAKQREEQSRLAAHGTCRACAHTTAPFLSLGELPLANALVDPALPVAAESRFPLTLTLCPACSLVQLAENVDPEKLFRH